MGARRNAEPGGARLYRGDDDGGTWTEVFASTSGASITGLAYDPEAPDRVYIALNTSGVVKASATGGATWTDLGCRTLPRINDLAPGVDGLNLYAATDEGVWRLSLAGGLPGTEGPGQVPKG